MAARRQHHDNILIMPSVPRATALMICCCSYFLVLHHSVPMASSFPTTKLPLQLPSSSSSRSLLLDPTASCRTTRDRRIIQPLWAGSDDGDLDLQPPASSASEILSRLENSNTIDESEGTTTNDTTTKEGGEGGGGIPMESIRNKMFAELEKLRQQFTDLTETLGQAKQEEEVAKGTFWRLREEREVVELEKEEAVQGVTKVFREEVDNLSDQLEETQDILRQTILQTRTQVTSLQNQAKETESRLQSEISSLESRLSSLKQEATNAANSRDAFEEQTKREMEEIKSSSRTDMENAKRKIASEKKTITRENWALETRIQEAGMEYVLAEKELKQEESVSPKISTLKDALTSMKQRMLPQVEEKKERRSAEEMFFATSIKRAKTDMRENFEKAKSDFEGQKSLEEEELEKTISSYEAQLAEKERETTSSIRSTNERAERSIAEAIDGAKKKRIELYQEKFESIQQQQQEMIESLIEAQETQSAWQDQYDAEYENEMRNLDNERILVEQQLEDEELMRQEQKRQLVLQMEELTVKLTQQMQDEKEAADEDFRRLNNAKSAELTGSMARTNKAMNDIQLTRSNLMLVKEELRKLESISREKGRILEELEEERSSFRKQFRRTLVVAKDRLTLKGLRSRRMKKP